MLLEAPASSVVEEKNPTDIVNAIYDDITSVLDYFDIKKDSATRNMNYYASRQWTEAEIESHHRQFRKPYVFNEIQRVVDSLCGTQVQTRMDSKCNPREKGDEAITEIVNFLLKWVEQINDIEYTESEVFQDGLLKGAGWSLIRWDNTDVVHGYPKIERIPYNEIFFDLNMKDITTKDCRWMARVIEMSVMDALEQFPWAQEQIKRCSKINGIGRGRLSTKRGYKSLFTKDTTAHDKRNYVQIVEHYEKVKTYEYTVIDDIGGNTLTFTQEQDALEAYDGIVEGYSELGVPILHVNGDALVAISKNTIDSIVQTILIGDEVGLREITALPDFPFVPFFCYFDDGDYWAFVDNLISPQDLINRSFSQLDFQLGASAKSAMTFIEGFLKKGFKPEDLRRELSKTAPLIPVTNHGAIQQVPNQPVNSELFNNIQFAIGRINDYGGGKNVMGLQESAAESGRAVIARAEQAGVGRLPFFDRLMLWRKMISERALWYIKNYMSAGQMIRILGTEGELKYIEIDDGILDTLQEQRYDITISESTKSETSKERYFQVIKEFNAIAPGAIPPNTLATLLLELSPLPETKRQFIYSKMEEDNKMATLKAQQSADAKMQEEVANIVKKKKLKEEMERADQLEQIQKEKQQQGPVKTRLDDLELLRSQAMANKGAVDKAAMDKLNTPKEIQGRNAASILGKLGVSM